MRGDRPSRDSVLMNMALAIADRGTCSRAKVGAIITRNGRPISTGYNGAPARLDHCDHTVTFQPAIMMTRGMNLESGCQIAVHAEANAIAFAARHGVATEDAALYCTHEPCANCAKLIINAGITEVYYLEPYRLHDGLELLKKSHVHIGQLFRKDAIL